MDYLAPSYVKRLLKERKELERNSGMFVVHECKISEYAQNETWMSLNDADNVFVSSFGRMIRENKRGSKQTILTDQKNYLNTRVLRVSGRDVRPHILVAKYFGAIGSGDHVKHINRDIHDNKIDNLKFVSKSELSRPPRIAREDTVKIPLSQFTLNGVFVRNWKDISEVVATTGARGGDILMCAEGETLSAFGYIWTFFTDSPMYDIYPKIYEKVQELDPYLIKGIYNGIVYLFTTISDASAVSGMSELDIIKMCVLNEQGNPWTFMHKGKTIRKDIG